MSDPIADMLTRIRNSYLARKKTAEVPYSQVKEKIAKILIKEKFLTKMEIQGKKPVGKKIILSLKYEGKEPVLTGVKRISKPGLRVYAKAGKIPRVRLGFGITIISTPSGLMTDQEARKKNLGGEVICQVW